MAGSASITAEYIILVKKMETPNDFLVEELNGRRLLHVSIRAKQFIGALTLEGKIL
jgi:hypothetical protein